MGAGWELNGASEMASDARKIFSGHHPKLRRDGRTMTFIYQKIELDEIGKKQQIYFMIGDSPREVQDVLNKLSEHGMPVHLIPSQGKPHSNVSGDNS
jgi:hypothetical protein